MGGVECFEKFQKGLYKMPTYCWILLLLLIVAIFCCICTCSFKNFKDKLYGFIDVKNTNDKTILEKELDFINKDILGFAKLALGVATTLAGFFKAFDVPLFIIVGVFGLSYIILYIIEMSIKSSYKNKIIEKLQKMEKNDEKTTTCH